jgi:hypothetical protein
MRELRRVPASQEQQPIPAKMGQPIGLPSISRNPHGYRHRTVQKTERPVLAATSPGPLTTLRVRLRCSRHGQGVPEGTPTSGESNPPDGSDAPFSVAEWESLGHGGKSS